jgi:O-antigen/teichoic acid export membrane protein
MSLKESLEKVKPFRELTRGIFPSNLVPWAGRGALAIADQGVFAGSNFLLNILLARWLKPADYGVFALAYSVFVLFSSLHSATLVEPMLVFGPGKYNQRLDEYLAILVRGHFLVMLPVSLLTGIAAFLAGHWFSNALDRAGLALAWTAPLILLPWLLRRAFYIELQPMWAMFGGILYAGVLLSLLFFVHLTGHLSTTTALAVMGLAAVIVSLPLLFRLRPCWRPESKGIEAVDVAVSHWRYGRWSLAAAAVGWVPFNIYYVLLPAWFGLEESAVLRALMNLINPGLHVLIALTPLLIPALVRNRRHAGRHGMNRTMTLCLALLLGGCGVFSLVVWFFRTQLFHLLYGSRYQNFGSTTLALLLLSLLATCFISVLGAAQMALERPDGNLWSYVASSVATILVGLPLAAWRGVEGAAEGLLFSTSVAAGFMYFFYRRAQFCETHLEAKAAEYTLVGK